ncbi:MAG: hypothetical protein ACLGI9_02650 [Thermoanaerobaculia bacterium]
MRDRIFLPIFLLVFALAAPAAMADPSPDPAAFDKKDKDKKDKTRETRIGSATGTATGIGGTGTGTTTVNTAVRKGCPTATCLRPESARSGTTIGRPDTSRHPPTVPPLAVRQRAPEDA